MTTKTTCIVWWIVFFVIDHSHCKPVICIFSKFAFCDHRMVNCFTISWTDMFALHCVFERLANLKLCAGVRRCGRIKSNHPKYHIRINSFFSSRALCPNAFSFITVAHIYIRTAVIFGDCILCGQFWLFPVGGGLGKIMAIIAMFQNDLNFKRIVGFVDQSIKLAPVICRNIASVLTCVQDNLIKIGFTHSQF